ncbi:MAG: hypothetical protein HYX97_00645, partial [Chloroflexi bacterium]|nr:hypothetical protein [Chloroflexota bacterium]
AYTDLSAYGGAPVSDNLVVRIEAATRWAPSGKRAEVRMVRFGPTGGLSLLNAAPEPGEGGMLAISSVTDGPGVFALVGLTTGGGSRLALAIGAGAGSAAAVAALGTALYLWRRNRSKASSA